LDIEGQHFTSTDEVQSAFINYFKSLFTYESACNMSPCLQPLERCVTEEMNNALLKTFTFEEVHGAIHDMAPLKALEPDGFIAGFSQKNWTIVGSMPQHW
jgi:hypothetical protein